MSKNQTFDISPSEKEVIDYRARKRLLLRNEYLRQVHDPNNKNAGHIFDPAIQRYYTANISADLFFKPTPKNFMLTTLITVGLISLVAWRIKVFRDAKELRYRTGEVSYRDRDWKFV